MRWDVFCKVIDNHGDLGVCWRLVRQLADSGETVRLWVDDASALAWMAPAGAPGVRVVPWLDPAACADALLDPAPDVVIEGFGCDPAPDLLAQFADRVRRTGRGAWINLEYLSAEPNVERLHGLPSPVFHGPGAGLVKRFFYPGFTDATGGLLREPDLAKRQATFDRAAWLAALGVDWRGERLVSLFCYEPAALPDLLAGLAQAPVPTRLLVTPGRAAAAVRVLISRKIGLQPAWMLDGALSISYLPYLAQPDFDHLLWACDLNFVRGEDSLVRALWAGAPLVWQIYPQDDDAHRAKLDAFLDRIDAPPSLRHLHRIWNGFDAAALPRLDADTLGGWRDVVRRARDGLLLQDDLLTRLLRQADQRS